MSCCARDLFDLAFLHGIELGFGDTIAIDNDVVGLRAEVSDRVGYEMEERVVLGDVGRFKLLQSAIALLAGEKKKKKKKRKEKEKKGEEVGRRREKRMKKEME